LRGPMAKAGCEVEMDHVAVRDVRAGPHAEAHHVGEPVLKEGVERQALDRGRLTESVGVDRAAQSIAECPARAREEGGRSHSPPSRSDRARARMGRSSEPEVLLLHGVN